MSEQRRDPRVNTKQGVWVEGQDLRIQAEARNMSKGGMFVVAPQGTSLGQTLEINFEDPSEGAISLKMEVVWRDEKSESTKFGLRALDSIGKAAFERVVTRYLDQEVEKTAENPGDGESKEKNG